MTRSLAFPLPLASLALLGLTACATAPGEGGDLAAAETANPDVALADAETREAADRAPPLERANFWAGEYAKDPSDPEATLRFGEALRAIGSFDRVIEIATQTLVLHPNNGALHLLKGRAHMALGQPELAVNAFNRASSNDPMNPAAYANLGLALDKVGQHRRAQSAYERALEIDPDRSATRSNYGLSLALSGSLARAEAELRAAAAAPDATSTIRQNLALVLGLRGDFDAMVEASQDAPDAVVEQNIAVLKALKGDGVLMESADRSETGEDQEDGDGEGLSLRGALDDIGVR
ncbi:MAG: tetratricopeptide repeat protein [Pseudomonadota bacterium]